MELALSAAADEALSVRVLAERQRIPARFLEQIFRDLRRAGIVGARRGAQGGFFFERAPSVVTVGEVIRALDGPELLSLDDSLLTGDDEPMRKAVEDTFDEIGTEVEMSFKAHTVESIAERVLKHRRARPRNYNYVI